MRGVKRGGLIYGLFAALGIGGLRLSGCATGVRALDDLVVAGVRSGLVDVVPSVYGEPAAGEVAGSGRVDGRMSELAESLAADARERGFELLTYDYHDAGLAKLGNRIRTPLVADLDRDAWVWEQLAYRRATDPRPKAGPWILTGRNQGDALFVGRELVPVRELARVCRVHTITCIFVGCTSNCGADSEQLFKRLRPKEGAAIDTFVAAYVAERLATGPNFVAIGRSELTVFRKAPAPER